MTLWRPGDEPQLLAGHHLVVSDPFTGTWSTWLSTVVSVDSPSPAERRPLLWGGLVAGDTDMDGRRERVRQARRDAINRALPGRDEPRVWQLTCTLRTVDVDETGRVSDDTGPLGWCELLLTPAAQLLPFDEFTANPHAAHGCAPVVWASDHALVTIGYINDVEVVFGD